MSDGDVVDVDGLGAEEDGLFCVGPDTGHKEWQQDREKMDRKRHVDERGLDTVVSGAVYKRRSARQWLAGAGSWWRQSLPQFLPAFCTNPELGVGTATGEPLKALKALRARGTCNHMLDLFSDPLSVPSKQWAT